MDQAHWDGVWQGRVPEQVTWFQADPATSFRLIQNVATTDSGIIDAGGGASRLVDRLLGAGYSDITVLDVAGSALAASRDRLGSAAHRVHWVVDDVRTVEFGRTFDVWHDRAVFHFLVDETERERYLATLRRALAPGGHVLLATFGPDGPETCSGLPVRRYDVALMQTTLGDDFELVDHIIELHTAPSEVTQQFLFGSFRRIG